MQYSLSYDQHSSYEDVSQHVFTDLNGLTRTFRVRPYNLRQPGNDISGINIYESVEGASGWNVRWFGDSRGTLSETRRRALTDNCLFTPGDPQIVTRNNFPSIWCANSKEYLFFFRSPEGRKLAIGVYHIASDTGDTFNPSVALRLEGQPDSREIILR